jgi:hypothetical protein
MQNMALHYKSNDNFKTFKYTSDAIGGKNSLHEHEWERLENAKTTINKSFDIDKILEEYSVQSYCHQTFKCQYCNSRVIIRSGQIYDEKVLNIDHIGQQHTHDCVMTLRQRTIRIKNYDIDAFPNYNEDEEIEPFQYYDTNKRCSCFVCKQIRRRK